MEEINYRRLSCIGILGGTFNPVHNGHLMMADAAITQFPDMERLIFMPNNLPAYKSCRDIISTEHRINMLRLAAEDRAYAAVSDMEIVRGGITYTADTMAAIRKINPDLKLYFIIGADSLFSFHKWYKYDKVLEQCILLVAGRDCDSDSMHEYAGRLIRKLGFGQIAFLDSRSVEAASSDIREEIGQGRMPEKLLPAKVCDYIKENHLYGWRI